MVTTQKFPTTQAEFAELDTPFLRLPGSFEEYLFLLNQPGLEVRVEYSDGHLNFTSYATDLHELIVGQIISLLNTQSWFRAQKIKMRTSNHLIYVDGFPRAFAPDAYTLLGEKQTFRPEGKRAMVANPWLLLEVLSPSTQAYDFGEKLLAYQSLPSAQYILYAYQTEPRVVLYYRDDRRLWRSREYDLTSPALRLGEGSFTVADFYDGILPEG